MILRLLHLLGWAFAGSGGRLLVAALRTPCALAEEQDDGIPAGWKL